MDPLVELSELPADAPIERAGHSLAAATVTTNDPDGYDGLWSHDRVHRLHLRSGRPTTPGELLARSCGRGTAGVLVDHRGDLTMPSRNTSALAALTARQTTCQHPCHVGETCKQFK